jgi:hypothetical protein
LAIANLSTTIFCRHIRRNSFGTCQALTKHRYKAKMDDEIRRRLKLALEMKGLDFYEVSKSAGLNRNYLWESFNRQKGSLDEFKKIADATGISFDWLISGNGEPYCTGAPLPLDRQLVTGALEVLLGELGGLDMAMSRNAALAILDIVERPPNGSSSIDKPSSIRIGILGVLRVCGRPPIP